MRGTDQESVEKKKHGEDSRERKRDDEEYKHQKIVARRTVPQRRRRLGKTQYAQVFHGSHVREGKSRHVKQQGNSRLKRHNPHTISLQKHALRSPGLYHLPWRCSRALL
mmetsp:Transcript_7051/g.11611  ORF Transcript_7051/g.11611 Transcript_7051/m.11611 type:complete len:109 (-) Transcript_7051:768-1094(-)